MNPEQIKDEIQKLNWCDRIGLYGWINEEIAGRPGIGADRSLQIREEIERMCKAAHPKTHFLERRVFKWPAPLPTSRAISCFVVGFHERLPIAVYRKKCIRFLAASRITNGGREGCQLFNH
jgi:hypothetical protein